MRRLKYLLLLTLAIVSYSTSSAQTWFDLGVKGSYGMTMMANTNIFDDRDVDHKITGGYGFGVSLGAHFGDHQGVLVEYMRSTGRQNFNEELGTVQTNNYEWSTNDVLLLYRYTGFGAYFEDIGNALGDCFCEVMITFEVSDVCTGTNVEVRSVLLAPFNGSPINGTGTLYNVEGDNGSYMITSSGLPVGTHTFYVRVADDCGNITNRLIEFTSSPRLLILWR